MTKPAKCKVCQTSYTKTRPLQTVCSPPCALTLARKATEKAQAKEQAKDRKETRAKLDAMQTKPELVKKAQTAVNAYIRARDAGKPCISCGKPLGTEPNTYDAGHFRSVGSAPHMRFVEDNIHGQCKHCNNYLGGNVLAYRKGLIERIGLERVEQIEADNTVRKYTHEGLREIAKQYREMARKLNDKKIF
jgi:hypothetical protein